MRISIDQNDAGYAAWEAMRGKQHVTILFNGVAVGDVMTADEEQSMIVRVLRDGAGQLIPGEDGESQTLTEYGEVKIEVAERPYNAGDEIREHIAAVAEIIERVRQDLHARAQLHDESKFSDEELPHVQAIGELARKEGKVAYGSPEYDARKKILEPMLAHHYAHNDHHPEYFGEKGVAGMTLMALTEMFCDWAAAGAARNPDGMCDLSVGIEKYKIPPMLAEILHNTAAALGIPHK